MQACPYDALYIDPETHTAAKCNYCAHRIDVGLEPACVNVCPTQAIVSGDLDDPNSKIATLKREQNVTARQTEKGTQPALFYIDGQPESLDPLATRPNDQFMWSGQVSGVGHFSDHGTEDKEHALDRLGRLLSFGEPSDKLTALETNKAKEITQAMAPAPKRAYDAPQKGILWGWQVSGYLWTKAISAGVMMVMLLGKLLSLVETNAVLENIIVGISFLFLALTGGLLVWDLDKPTRFLYVLLRPQWKSWLVRGAYIITVFSGLLILFGLMPNTARFAVGWPLLIFAVLTAVYTAWLFGQAKGRDAWQNPSLSFHMAIHSLIAGAAVLAISTFGCGPEWCLFLVRTLIASIVLNIAFTAFDFLGVNHSPAAKLVADATLNGRYKNLFWYGFICLGTLVPLLLLLLTPVSWLPLTGILLLFGVFASQHILVRVPQQIPLS